MARERKRPEVDPPALSMTPMIDVVFQLLIYFVVTLHPVDVITNLDVFQPAPDPNAKQDEKPPTPMRIAVLPQGHYAFNDNAMSLNTIDANLEKVARINPSTTIMIVIASQSKHGDLVRLLDVCAKNNLRSLSVVSSQN